MENADEFLIFKIISLPGAIVYKKNERPSFRTGNGSAQVIEMDMKD